MTQKSYVLNNYEQVARHIACQAATSFEKLLYEKWCVQRRGKL